MVAENRKRVRRQRARGDVQTKGIEFPGNFIHVGNHQQQTL